MRNRTAFFARKPLAGCAVLKGIAVVLLAILVASCASIAQAGPEDYSRMYANKDSGELFDAARAVLFELSAQVENADRENGYIQAVVSHTSFTTTMLTGTATITTRYTVNILGDQIRVRIANISGRDEYDAPKQAYADWWSAFEDKL